MIRVTIIGAGLSGLAIAYRLKAAGVSVSILEAADVIGGRIQPAVTHRLTENETDYIHQDLGPSWVWPYAQPVVEDWFDELNIQTFPQFEKGDVIVDLQSELRQQFVPSQQGVTRIKGGTHALIQALSRELEGVMSCNHVVRACRNDQSATTGKDQLTVDVQVNDEQKTSSTDVLILALPPRKAAQLIVDVPEFSDVSSVLNRTPTWMAAHAKVVMLYKTAFWRERGLSGRIVSQVGPLSEVHDHCGPDGQSAALFGFSGVPADLRKDVAQFSAEVKAQLVRCFGQDAPLPEEIIVQDWACQRFIATDADLAGPMSHPAVMDEVVRQPHWNNRLWFAASETSTVSPGLIEGALARADAVADEVTRLYR